MHVDNYLTYIGNKEDEQYLRSRLPDVNMRLFKTSSNYRRIVQSCCKYLSFLALADMEGYNKPYGMSGANIAIPFNIIGIVKFRNTEHAWCQIMINPTVLNVGKEQVITKTNCGSIRLPELINVKRYAKIELQWFNTDGEPQTGVFTRENGGFTIQHEIDHNEGILITDIGELEAVSTCS